MKRKPSEIHWHLRYVLMKFGEQWDNATRAQTDAKRWKRRQENLVEMKKFFRFVSVWMFVAALLLYPFFRTMAFGYFAAVGLFILVGFAAHIGSKIVERHMKKPVRTAEEQALLDDPKNAYLIAVRNSMERFGRLCDRWNNYVKRRRTGAVSPHPQEEEIEKSLHRTDNFLEKHQQRACDLLDIPSEVETDHTPIGLAPSLEEIRIAESALLPVRIAETYRVAIPEKPKDDLLSLEEVLEAAELEEHTLARRRT